jgi:hypothetical protein
MEVSEGTVKSRLHYARLAIKDGVEAHEKKGIKLYTVSGLPLLYYVLREGAVQTALSPVAIAGLWETASIGIAVGEAAAVAGKTVAQFL